jgi:hypothetical protein
MTDRGFAGVPRFQASCTGYLSASFGAEYPAPAADLTDLAALVRDPKCWSQVKII